MENKEAVGGEAVKAELVERVMGAWEMFMHGGGLVNLHPMHGMKVVKVEGNERRFTPSALTLKRKADAKLAKKNYQSPMAVHRFRENALKRMVKVGVAMTKPAGGPNKKKK